ncbi:MAG: amino acid permease [Synergistaceae bacterium]|nr:amino acid permease [Synergistaceae bacterium]
MPEKTIKSENVGLDRYLSPLGAWALAFGCAAGWRVFIMPETTFLPAAGSAGILAGMGIGTLLMLVVAWNYHFLMSRCGGSGGAFAYTKAAFGYDHGFLCAWFLALTYAAVLWANAAAVFLIFRYLAGGLLQWGFLYNVAGYDVYLGEVIASVGAALLFGFLCLRSKRLAGTLQIVMSILLFAGILFCMGVAFRAGGAESLLPLLVPEKGRYLRLLQLAVMMPWAFVGFESVSHSTGEFKFPPKKSFAPLAAAVLMVGVSYMMPAWIAASFHQEGLGEALSRARDTRGFSVLSALFALDTEVGPAGLPVLAVLLLSVVGTSLIGHYVSTSRLLYALAGEGVISGKYHSLNRERVPQRAILLIMGSSVLIPFFGRAAIGWIVDITSVGATIAYGYVSAAAFKTARGEGRRGAALCGALGVALSAGSFGLAFVPNLWSVGTMATESYLILTVWSILGLAFFWRVSARDGEQRFGKSVVVWIVILFLIFFVSAIWMRQAIQSEMDPLIESVLVQGVMRSSLVRNSLIQMGICLLSLVMMFNIFSVQNRKHKALETARMVAERANATKSEFLASMSHEIRTPINAVLGMNEMVIRESRDKRVTTYARNVESAGKNLLSIINDILDFSKIEAGRMEIVEADYKFSSLLNDVTNMILFKAKQKNLRFDIEVDEALPDDLHGDPVRVRQVVVNVLNNAVKYTHEGGVSLHVTGERNENGLTLVFRVTDTGIGIRQEDLPKLFGKFQRVDLEKNSTIEGTGLGLSITKNLLDMMGGAVEVESEYGKGSTFTIRLPQKIVSDEPIGNFQEKFEQYVHSLRAYHESFRAPDARVLVVDDTEMNLTVVEGLLSKTEVRIDKAASGFEALALTKRNRYDLILMDHRMPQMDGTEALGHVRTQEGGLNRETPIICLTADAMTGARARFIAEGFTDYLSKPIEGPTLEAALIKYLPPEKVAIREEDTEEPESASGERTELEEFYASAPDLSYGDAVRFCSSEDVLKKTLEQFYRSIKSNANAIDAFLMAKDYKNYTIKVHALKSSARLIGAGKLSADARYLEDLGNSLTEEDIRRIGELTPKLLEDYRRFLDILSPLYAAEEEAREAAPEITADELHEAYEAIRQFVEGFDIDAIDGFISEIRKHRIPKLEEAKFALIEECVRNMDWNALDEALRR